MCVATHEHVYVIKMRIATVMVYCRISKTVVGMSGEHAIVHNTRTKYPSTTTALNIYIYYDMI